MQGFGQMARNPVGKHLWWKVTYLMLRFQKEKREIQDMQHCGVITRDQGEQKGRLEVKVQIMNNFVETPKNPHVRGQVATDLIPNGSLQQATGGIQFKRGDARTMTSSNGMRKGPKV